MRAERRWHADQDRVGLAGTLELSGRFEPTSGHLLADKVVPQVPNRAASTAQNGYPLLIDVEAENTKACLCRRPHQRQANIAQSHDPDDPLPGANSGDQGGNSHAIGICYVVNLNCRDLWFDAGGGLDVFPRQVFPSSLFV